MPGVLTLKLLIFNIYFSILVLNSINVTLKRKKEAAFWQDLFLPLYQHLLCDVIAFAR